MKKNSEKRRYDRYGSKMPIACRVIYDFKTQIKYQIIEYGEEKILSEKYDGVSKDISAEGFGFISSQQLNKGDIVRIEVYIPGREEPVHLDGEVRWSQPVPSLGRERGYETGVHVFRVNGTLVADTVRFDKIRGIHWSEVLDVILKHFLDQDKENRE